IQPVQAPPPGLSGPPPVPPPIPSAPVVPPGSPPVGVNPIPFTPGPATGSPGPPAVVPPLVMPPAAVPGPRAATPALPFPAGTSQAYSYSIMPRTSTGFSFQDIPMPNGELAKVITGGIILTIRNDKGVTLLDMEADRAVVWMRRDAAERFRGLQTPAGQTSNEYEFYLSGNVELRQSDPKETRTLRADEVYYDTSRNVAVATKADLEIVDLVPFRPGMPLHDPIHLKAEELDQLAPKHYRAVKAELFSSKLPSDPGLKVYVAEATLDDTV